jgi:hypothetical protein
MDFYREQFNKQREIIHKLQKEVDFKSSGSAEVSSITAGKQPKFSGEEGFLPEELEFWNTKA